MKYLLIKPRKENIMGDNKMKQITQTGVNATMETGWAIGTSIAASAAPLSPIQIPDHYFFNAGCRYL